MAIFFLVPLGFIAYGWGPKILWPGFAFAFFGNCILILGTGLTVGHPLGNMAWDILFFSVTAASFAWIILPPHEYGSRIPGPYRLAIGSSICALVSIGLFFRVVNSPVFQENVMSQVELIASLYSGYEIEGYLLESINIDAVIIAMTNIMIRGGALISSVFILFVSRQISIFLVRLFGGLRRSDVFVSFRVDQRLVWVFCFSLLLLTISSLLRMAGLGIILWNIVILCSMMYLAQGLGILNFFLLKPKIPSFLRFVAPVLFIFLIFSPGINAILLGIIILLGIAENWVSLRATGARKDFSNGPPSTPEA